MLEEKGSLSIAEAGGCALVPSCSGERRPPTPGVVVRHVGGSAGAPRSITVAMGSSGLERRLGAPVRAAPAPTSARPERLPSAGRSAGTSLAVSHSRPVLARLLALRDRFSSLAARALLLSRLASAADSIVSGCGRPGGCRGIFGLVISSGLDIGSGVSSSRSDLPMRGLAAAAGSLAGRAASGFPLLASGWKLTCPLASGLPVRIAPDRPGFRPTMRPVGGGGSGSALLRSLITTGCGTESPSISNC
jgi:hypothetical protein